MCGRFSRKSTMQAIIDEFEIMQSEREFEPRYNIAPAQNVAVIIQDKGRKLTAFRWGLIPSWVKDPAIGNKMINARAETLLDKPSFKNAFKKRRCLIIADGFFEWKKSGEEKIPMYIYLKTEKPFAFAGLWETWKSPDGKIIHSCAIITTVPNELMLTIHNRMPAILNKNDVATWIDIPNPTDSSLIDLLKPYPSDAMTAYQVSKIVNPPHNDVAACIKPVNLT
jgi:putative SOS response-associated peptidase YedK